MFRKQVELQTWSLFSCKILLILLKNKIQQNASALLTVLVIQIIVITVYCVEQQDKTCDSWLPPEAHKTLTQAPWKPAKFLTANSSDSNIESERRMLLLINQDQYIQ